MLRTSTSLAILTLALVACDRNTTRRDADAASTNASARESSEALRPTVGASVRTIELGNRAGTSMRVTGATTNFTPTDTMFLAVIVDNPTEDSRLTARWTAADGAVIDSSGQDVDRDMGSTQSVTQFRLTHDKNAWPVGKYTVDVWLNDMLVGTKMFTVAR